jgi:hypothetical protein
MYYIGVIYKGKSNNPYVLIANRHGEEASYFFLSQHIEDGSGDHRPYGWGSSMTPANSVHWDDDRSVWEAWVFIGCPYIMCGILYNSKKTADDALWYSLTLHGQRGQGMCYEIIAGFSIIGVDDTKNFLLANNDVA